MTFDLHRVLRKKLKKLPVKIQEKFYERVALFQIEPFSPILENHALMGTYEGYRSINITGDYRALFKLSAEKVAIFYEVDTHHNLFGI